MTHIWIEKAKVEQALDIAGSAMKDAIKFIDALKAENASLRQAIAEAEKQEPEAAPVAKNEGGKITWMIDDWPQNCLLYTHPPKSFTYEQVKAHIRAASMSANDISLGSDVTDDGVSIVIRRRDEVLYAEFFANPQPAQPKQDHVAWEASGKLTALREVQAFVNQHVRDAEHNLLLLAANPQPAQPQREWVGLTDEEMRQMCGSVPSIKDAVREAEAKLKEKNT